MPSYLYVYLRALIYKNLQNAAEGGMGPSCSGADPKIYRWVRSAMALWLTLWIDPCCYTHPLGYIYRVFAGFLLRTPFKSFRDTVAFHHACTLFPKRKVTFF